MIHTFTKDVEAYTALVTYDFEVSYFQSYLNKKEAELHQ